MGVTMVVTLVIVAVVAVTIVPVRLIVVVMSVVMPVVVAVVVIAPVSMRAALARLDEGEYRFFPHRAPVLVVVVVTRLGVFCHDGSIPYRGIRASAGMVRPGPQGASK